VNEFVAPLIFFGAIGLLAIGIAGMVLSRHLFRMILALAIAEAGANLLLVIAGYRWDAVAPVLRGDAPPGPMVDPVPQAMVLTAIVIGVGVQALAVSLAIRVRAAYGTLDMHEVRRRMEADLAAEAGVAPAGSQESPDEVPPLPAPGFRGVTGGIAAESDR
jgi:multisubunit Na+/H+ antiporter MnhC subunit